LGVVSALLLLARVEGIFLLLSLAIEHFRLGRAFPPSRYFLAPGVILALPVTFNFVYYGTPLSHSALAKIYQGWSGLWGRFSFLKYGLELRHLVYGGLGLLLVITVLALVGFVSLRRHSLNRIIFLFLLFYTAFFVLLRIPGQIWYFGPYHIALWFYAGLGLGYLFRKCLESKRLIGYAAMLLIVLCLVLAHVRAFRILYPMLGQMIHKQYRTVGLWLNEHTAAGSSIALVEIGTVGWYSKRPIVDILGLVTPRNARFVAERDLEAWTQLCAPDYLLVHEPRRGFEDAADLLLEKRSYEPDSRFQLDGFLLLRRKEAENNQPAVR
jgi:hypothetical protein